jgi:cytochrome P450
MMNDPKYWINADAFDPNRFLTSDGIFTSSVPEVFIPFGIGKRYCIGDKLAEMDTFLVISRLLQQIKGLTFELANGVGSADLQPKNKFTTLLPKPFEIMLKTI